MAQVLDYSAGFPGARAIRDAGYAGAVRYIGFPDRLKCTDADELEDFDRHGLGMALVYEDHADDWRGGYTAGAAAARRARAHADAIGFPQNRPIYMAVDRDVVTEAEFRAAMDYLRGAAGVLGVELTGVYGEHDVCARAAAEGVARWFWQCRAWSGTPPRMFAGRHLYQHYGDGRGGPAPIVGGIECDINDPLQDDWGQHTAEGDVVTPQDKKDIIDGVTNAIFGRLVPQRQFGGGTVPVDVQGALEFLDYRAQSTNEAVAVVAKSLDAQSLVLKQLAEEDDRIDLDPGDLETLGESVRAKLDEIAEQQSQQLEQFTQRVEARIDEAADHLANQPADVVRAGLRSLLGFSEPEADTSTQTS